MTCPDVEVIKWCSSDYGNIVVETCIEFVKNKRLVLRYQMCLSVCSLDILIISKTEMFAKDSKDVSVNMYEQLIALKT